MQGTSSRQATARQARAGGPELLGWELACVDCRSYTGTGLPAAARSPCCCCCWCISVRASATASASEVEALAALRLLSLPLLKRACSIHVISHECLLLW